MYLSITMSRIGLAVKSRMRCIKPAEMDGILYRSVGTLFWDILFITGITSPIILLRPRRGTLLPTVHFAGDTTILSKQIIINQSLIFNHYFKHTNRK